MNNEKYNQIIDETYNNYLNNFEPNQCPPNLDVQPDYYDPMSKELFIKFAKEQGLRGKMFSEKWGLKIEERELNDDERNIFHLLKMNPTKLIAITYNNEKIEIYE